MISLPQSNLKRKLPSAEIGGEKLITKREGLMLYWCEGDKHRIKSRCRVGVTCGDAKLLKLFTDWLVKYYSVARDSIKLRLHLWRGESETEAKKYWSGALDIPAQNFTKSWIKPRAGKCKKYPFGICRASISSKRIHTQILSEIEKEFREK